LPHINEVEAYVLNAVGNIFVGMSGGRWRITDFMCFSEFGERIKQWRLFFSR
jgi:hypothetical protein